MKHCLLFVREACFCTTAAAQLNEPPRLLRASRQARSSSWASGGGGGNAWAQVGLLLPCWDLALQRKAAGAAGGGWLGAAVARVGVRGAAPGAAAWTSAGISVDLGGPPPRHTYGPPSSVLLVPRIPAAASLHHHRPPDLGPGA